MQAAITREVLAVRNNVGCVDMSTLGKYEVHGSDAREFLSRVYCNNFAALKPGRLRYGLMLREDGIVFDDGTIACLSENRFLITATTATSISVWRHLKRLSQLEWPDLDVFLTEVTDQWASLAIAGPKSRNVLQSLEPDFDIDKDGFPFASVRSGTFGRDLPARVFSVSFSGELSFEINVPSGFADTLFDRVMSKGGAWGITPYGLETLDVLRIEKGHLSIGTEIDGRRTPADIGLGHMVSDRKAFVGRKLLERPAFQDDNRPQLVGLQPIDGLTPIPPGAHLSRDPSRQRQPVLEGYLTASVFSPTLGHPIALAWLKGGASRHEQTLWAHSPVAGQSVEVKVSAPHFYDPKGTRLHG